MKTTRILVTVLYITVVMAVSLHFHAPAFSDEIHLEQKENTHGSIFHLNGICLISQMRADFTTYYPADTFTFEIYNYSVTGIFGFTSIITDPVYNNIPARAPPYPFSLTV